MSQVTTPKDTSTQKPPSAGPEAQVDKKASLRGKPFDAQEKLLAPGAQEKGGDKLGGAIAYNQKAPFPSGNVQPIQTLVKANATGAWDAPTVEGVMTFQRAHGLDDDGKVGRDTTHVMKRELGAEGAADKTSAPKDKPKAEAPPVVATQSAGASSAAPTAAPASGSASGILTQKQIVVAQKQYRNDPFAPEWVAKLQVALGMAPTMVIDPSTIQKIADYQQSKGVKPTGFLRAKDTLGPLVAEHPELVEAKGTEHARKSTDKGAGKSVGSPEPLEDQAMRELGVAGGINGYVKTFQTMTFLGATVVGRPEFLARIGAAKSYLMAKFKASDAEVAKQVGCSVSNSYRPSTPDSPQAYHGIGQAFDIDHDKNPWVVGNPQAKTANDGTTSILRHATTFMGSGEGFDAKKLHQWAQELSTEDLYAQLEATNVSLRQYREMAKDPAAIRAQFDKRMKDAKPLAGDEAKVEYWLKKVPLHDTMLRGDKSNWHGQTGNLGIMNQSKDVVVALRDVAGLRWGATDMGESQSSDMMHWDNDHDGPAHALWAKTKALRDAAKKPEKK